MPGRVGHEVRIGADVGGELRPAESNGPPHDAAFDAQAVRDDRVSALCDQPEAAVLEDEDRGEKTGDSSMQRLHGRGNC